MYITPARVATMGLGVDLTSISTADLRAICARASATIDAVCAVPRLPQKHDFRGGVITGERHVWHIDQDERPHPNRVYPVHVLGGDPIVSVERFDIKIDNVNKVSLEPSTIVIHNEGGYLEASTLLLSQYGVYGAGIIPFIGTYEPIVEVDYTYRYEFGVVDEQAEFVDGKTYQCVNQFWLAGADVTVKVDGVTKVVTTDYAIEAAEGRIRFVENQPADAEVLVSYTHTLPWEISQAAGLLVAEEMGDIDVRKSGLTGLDSLRVVQGGGASVEKVREGARRGAARASSDMSDLPPEVQRLLVGFVFTSFG